MVVWGPVAGSFAWKQVGGAGYLAADTAGQSLRLDHGVARLSRIVWMRFSPSSQIELARAHSAQAGQLGGCADERAV